MTPIPEWAKLESDILPMDQLDTYLNSLMEQNPIDMNALLELDAQGIDMQIDGVTKHVSNMILDIQDAATTTSDEFHQSAIELHEWSDAWEGIRSGTEAPDNSSRIASLEEEKSLALEINSIRSTTEDSSFNFMSNSIPSGQNNPLNYYENWASAYTKLTTAFSKKNIDYTDWYNIITEFQNIADLTGTTFDIGGKKIESGMNSAAELIEAGAAALRDVDKDGDLEVDLSQLGIDLTSGAV